MGAWMDEKRLLIPPSRSKQHLIRTASISSTHPLTHPPTYLPSKGRKIVNEAFPIHVSKEGP